MNNSIALEAAVDRIVFRSFEYRIDNEEPFVRRIF